MIAFACSVAVLVSALASCTNTDQTTRPATLTVTTTSTVPIDLSGVKLRGVRGSTTTTLPTDPGVASITGRVTEPNGDPATGVTVIARWYVTDTPTEFQTLTAFDGTYSLTGLRGGRWRVRAFRIPDQATPKAQTFFMKTDENKTLDLVVEPLTGIAITDATAPDPPIVGAPTELTVRAFRRSVDVRGRVTEEPVRAFTLTLVTIGEWSVSDSKTRLTGFDGTTRWTLTCETEGSQQLAIDAGGDRTNLTLPACVRAEPSSTTTTVTKPAGA